MPVCKHCGGETAHDGYAVKMADGGLVMTGHPMETAANPDEADLYQKGNSLGARPMPKPMAGYSKPAMYAHGGKVGGYAKGGSIPRPHGSGGPFEGEEHQQGDWEETEEHNETAQMGGVREARGLEYGREEEEVSNVEPTETEQQTRTEAAFDGAFIDRMKHKIRHAKNYAQGGEVGQYGKGPDNASGHMLNEEMIAKKKAKYGFHGFRSRLP
jgi:hypothetical protein